VANESTAELQYFRWLLSRRNKHQLFSSAPQADENEPIFVGQLPTKIALLFSSATLADENVNVFSTAFLADKNIVIFVGCQRKRSYFRLLFRWPNFIGRPTKIAIFDGFWSIFIGFWPTKIHCFPVVNGI
jgi:hypothetical protein